MICAAITAALKLPTPFDVNTSITNSFASSRLIPQPPQNGAAPRLRFGGCRVWRTVPIQCRTAHPTDRPHVCATGFPSATQRRFRLASRRTSFPGPHVRGCCFEGDACCLGGVVGRLDVLGIFENRLARRFNRFVTDAHSFNIAHASILLCFTLN